MKISLGSWAFSFGPYADDPVPLNRTVQRLAEAGFDGIELCGFPPHATLDAYPTTASRRELAQFIAGHGLGISGYSADFTLVNPVAPYNQNAYLDLVRRHVEMCADVGSPCLRVDSGAAPGSIDDREYATAQARLADVWRQAAEIAAAASVRLVWEFEPGFAFNKPSEVLALHSAVGHDNFRVLFDTSHAHMCAVRGARQHGESETLRGGVPALLDMLAGRIGAIHLIDSDGTLYAGETSTHAPFGEGLIGFPALAPKLLAVPGISWWCIDLCFIHGAWDLVEHSLRFVRDLERNALT